METRDDKRYEEYCKVRNQVRNLTRKAVVNKEIAKEIKKNPKKFWQYTQSKTKTRTGMSDVIMDEQNGTEILTKDDTDKAIPCLVSSQVYLPLRTVNIFH